MINTILVPTDFTAAADKALQHAAFLAKKSGAKLYLLHLCESSKNIEETKEKLAKQIKNEATELAIEAIARVGSYKDVAVVAEELSVDIIFMGTHGTNGMQKIMGSNALNLVTKSKVPFIIVQEDSPLPSGYKKIIVPTSFHFESKQKITGVAAIAEYFKSEVCFIYSDNDPIMKAKSLANLVGMEKYLKKRNLKYNVTVSSGSNFNADTLAAAENKSAELIAIMNMQKDDVLGTGLFGKHYEQEIIMNDQKIPVLISNPNNTQLFGSTLNIFRV